MYVDFLMTMKRYKHNVMVTIEYTNFIINNLKISD